jgi:dTDP-4-dehydrorhamnose 3,5-epimerase-like enzyme
MTRTQFMLLELPKITDSRGSLSFLEANRHIPFEIRRAFYLYGVPEGEERAGHALTRCHQFILAMSGSFEVIVDDGVVKEHFLLGRSDCGLYVPPLFWRELRDFSKDSVCLVLASELYDPADYIDDYSEFKRKVGADKK